MSDVQLSQADKVSTQGPEVEIELLALLGALLDQKWTVIISTVCVTHWQWPMPFLERPCIKQVLFYKSKRKPRAYRGWKILRGVWFGVLHPSGTRNLKSRSVVGTAVTNLNLTTLAEPVFFPIIGDFLHRQFQPTGTPSNRVSRTRVCAVSAWGGESIAVSRLEVNGALLGEPLIITVKGDNAFTLQNDDFGIELSGTVGNY